MSIFNTQGSSSILGKQHCKSITNPLKATKSLTKTSPSIITKDELLMGGLLKFFAQSFNLDQLLIILEGKSILSLRILDWFSTNYSKQYDIVYNIKKCDTIRQFMVYNHYKAQLKGYSKKQFDPFCRGKRIFLNLGEGKEIETTVGQLNFFRWAIENKVLDYITKNFTEIKDDMNLRGSKAKDRKEKQEIAKKEGQKRELSVSAIKTMTKHDIIVTVKFD